MSGGRAASEAPEASETIAWIDRPRRELLRLALPISTALVTKAIVGTVDAGFVGTLGQEPLAGVGLAAVLHMLLTSIPLGLLGALSIVTSQARGAAQGRRLEGLLGAGLLLAGALCVVLGLLGWGLSGLTGTLSATEAAGDAAQVYLLIRLLELPSGFLAGALRGFRHGLGDTRSPMVAGVVTAALNLPLDYLFVIRWEWGVEGAAWATVLAYFIQAVLMVAIQWRAPERPRWPARSELMSLGRLGVPAGLQQLLENGVWVAVTILIASFGSRQLAAHHVATWLLYLILLLPRMLGEAGSIMCGQALGAGHREVVGMVARRSIELALVFYVPLMLLLIALRGPAASLFADDPALASTISIVLLVGGLGQVIDVGKQVARGILRGVGDVQVPAAVSIVMLWTLNPLLVYLLGGLMGLGVIGAWIGFSIESILTTAYLWRRLTRGRWNRSADRSMAELRTSRQ